MIRKKAIIILRDNGHVKIPAFFHGFEAAGYVTANSSAIKDMGENDVLLCWNRHPGISHFCSMAENRGARVVIAENGYVGNDPTGRQYFAMALGHHNGAGSWPVGDEERFARMNIPLAEWRKDGSHILILPQRGIGEDGVRMPPKWGEKIRQVLRTVTRRPLKYRTHPGRVKIPLEPDLVNCWAAVTWASGAGIKALAAGIPVFHDFKKWIGASAAIPLRTSIGSISNLERPFLGDRLPMFKRLAWAQFSLEEIESGFAISWILKG